MSNKSLIKQLLTESKQILTRIRNSIDKRTYSAYITKVHVLNHLASIKKMNKELKQLEKATQKTDAKNVSIKSVKKAQKIKPILKKYFVSGIVHTKTKYMYETKKRGVQISKDYFSEKPEALVITAYSENEAKQKFNEAMVEVFTTVNDASYDEHKNIVVDDITNINIQPYDVFADEDEHNMPMFHARPVTYDFIPNDEKYNENNGFCVSDVMVNVYNIKLEKFIELCYEVRGEKQNINKQVSLLDVDIEDDDEPLMQWTASSSMGVATSPPRKQGVQWTLDKGVTPNMLYQICQKLDISHYAFDITNKCFLKYVSKNRNHAPLIYYCVNNHMYWVSDKDASLSLIRNSQDISTKFRSICLTDETKENENIFALELYENVPVEELKNYKNCTIIYAKNNLNEELDDIILTYNRIPKIKNDNYNVTQIHMKQFNINLVAFKDDNFTFQQIKELCEKYKIEWKCQTFGTFIHQLKKQFFDAKHISHKFTQDERKAMYEEQSSCESCNKKLSLKGFHIEHIVPLACGGTNDKENLQILCPPCHFEKTRNEQENGYVKVSETMSNFNITTKEIINSSLTSSYAFIQKLPFEDKKQPLNKVFHIDINKCRKNILYYSKYNYPLFTVMDEPVIYNGKKETGLYYVESDNCLPLRGNGWYSLPLVEYCLSNNIINENNIKYALYSSLSIPYNYYNEFIDFVYGSLGADAKLCINTMIGMFKPKPKEKWNSILITKDANIAFHHYLDKNGCFIDSRKIGDEQYYQVYNKYRTEQNESECCIYNQILEIEAIELHKLMTLVRNNNGKVLYVNTDSVSCVFPTNEAFDISKYYWNELNNVLKYKFEEKNIDDDIMKLINEYNEKPKEEQKKINIRQKIYVDMFQIERLPNYKRNESYQHNDRQLNLIHDVEDNNFKPLMDTILNSKKSFHIDGRAGCGKSTLVKMIQEELTNRGVKFNSLAPTNKACRIINGQTVHKFVISNTSKTLQEMDIKYLFIDEISMMSELFYNYFLMLKQLRTDIKFIIAGDFAQLLPVNERIKDCNYKDKIALYELCDFNRLQLNKCRRADDTLYNMLLPDNINKIVKSDFGNKFTDKHICFTNKKRMEINEKMMNKFIADKEKQSKRKQKPVLLEALSFDGNSQNVKLLKGMPVIARKNNKELGICNNDMFDIKDIKVCEVNKKKEQYVILNDGSEKDIYIATANFQNLFYIAFCITTHKSQGSTFNAPYTVHEFNLFDERLKYVALSRATDKKLINIY